VSKRDYYDVLGVSRDANPDQIKKAYRQLALKYHPDRNPGDHECEEHFKEASEAYQILSDSDNRAKYDRFGHAAFGQGLNGFDFTGFAEDLFGDIFGAFFGTGAARQQRRGGRDLRFHLDITLEEAAFGAEKEVTLPKPAQCETCKGERVRPGTKAERCRQCDGAGQIRIQQGFFTIARSCSACAGAGTVIKDPCPKCGGSGKVTKEQKLSIKIPAGINDGQTLKHRGEGEPGPQGLPAGDLFIEIGVQPHAVFRRQDTELLCEVPVTYAQAALGAEIEVPTLQGTLSMKMPPGTQSGTTFRLRGQGIVDMHSGRKGDLHVRTFVFVPKSVNPEERDLLERLAQVEGKPQPGESRSFFDKVKEFFE
jgi:molecular chaperone DnaJ